MPERSPLRRGWTDWFSGYPAWVVKRHRLICVAWLLPNGQPSVVALRQLLARKTGSAVVEIGVASPSPDVTQRFATDLAVALRQKLPADVLSDVDDDDADIRSFVWGHRHLYASRADLESALESLKSRVIKASPFDLGLDDDDPKAEAAVSAADRKRLDDLQHRLDEVRAKQERPPGYVGEEGRLRMLVLRLRFADTEPEKGDATMTAVKAIVAGMEPAHYDPALEVGYAGDMVSGAQEHDLILHDIVLTTVLCLVLVAGALVVYFRAVRAVLALCVTLIAACCVTFGFTRLCIGHLNTSTAFLGSVVAGNGINFGIILLARYFEERRRRGLSHEEAVVTALSRTAIPTLVASAAAGSAYLSLTITTFRGFSEFGIIAGSGMAFCWIATYVLLPALLTLTDHRVPLVRAVSGPPSGARRSWSAENPRAAAAVSLGIVALTTGLALVGARELYTNPFEDDVTVLRSRSYATSPVGRWSKRLDAAFGRDQAGGFFVGVERPEDVAAVVKAVRDLERDTPEEKRQFGKIDALSEVLPGDPAEQQEKIRLLGELRRLTDRITPRLTPGSADAKLMADLRPPPVADIHPIAFDDLPERVRRAFTEKDGRHGLLLGVHPGAGFDGTSFHGLERAVALLRALKLPPGAEVSGSEVIFVEMMEAVVREGPRASILSLVLVLLLLLITFGLRWGLALTTAALFIGVFGMFGLMSLTGVRLNFLNYIAVPITIGIGCDYPFNMVARLRQEGWYATRGVLRTASAVALCSCTTIIGYAVLLLSDTGAIRSFGAAAVLGELTCISAALVVVPALVIIGALFTHRGSPAKAAPAP